MTDVAPRAQELLETMAGPSARLRADQAAAIEAVVVHRRRILVVQRTGFGKSAVYFIATRLLRDGGAGPTLVVSPLLALMRDQVVAAAAMGVRSETINSSNPDEWEEIEARLAAGAIDLLAISPERLNSPGFARRVLPRLAAGLGLLVVDEAHCISDWGHDFRPDYRRIGDAIANLAPGTPVIATTATANARVAADVAAQLGDDVLTLRGPLDRESLHLGVVHQPTLAHRLAWLAERIPAVAGTGIVYCLTVDRTTQVASFLRSQGIDAAAYSSETPTGARAGLEERFKANELKVLVATSALGMGVDKPDVTFVYHLGSPPSPIAYYQQVGRAGRNVAYAEAWLLPGEDDRRIWDWFAGVGLPDEPLVRRVLDVLDGEPVGLTELERAVDLRRTRLETLLKILDVEGAVTRTTAGWARTGSAWRYDHERVARIRAAREAEATAMLTYADDATCSMAFLRTALDDPDAGPCGRCAACGANPDPVVVDPAVVAAAVAYLRTVDVALEPRKQWPRGLDAPKGSPQNYLGLPRSHTAGQDPETSQVVLRRVPKGNIKADARPAEGRALARIGDAGWWPTVDAALAGDAGALDELLTGIAVTLKRWPWAVRPRWVTWIPSTAQGDLLGEVAGRIGAAGTLPVHGVLTRTRAGRPQAEVQNSAHRLRNVWDAFAVDSGRLPDADRLAGPVLVLDDLFDSGWTMTVVAGLLRAAGAGAVLPFTLARR